MSWQDGTPVAAPVASGWQSGAPSLPVVTDDSLPWDASDQQRQNAARGFYGLLQDAGANIGSAIAHPIATAQAAWNSPNFSTIAALKGAAASLKDAASIPGDVLTGKSSLSDPNMAGRMANAALLASPVTPAALGGNVLAPSTEDLFREGGAGFDAWRNSGLDRPAEDAKNWARQFQGNLNAEGILNVPAGAPSTHAILDRIQASGAPTATPAELDAIRKSFVHTIGGAGANATERMAGARARNDFLSFLENAAPQDVVAGTAPAVAATQGLRDAIGNWAAAERSNTLNTLEDNAELRAQASHSGHAGSNPLRQTVASALRINPATGQSFASRSGFSPEEIDALRSEVVQGAPVNNAVRTAANMAGGGLGHMGFIGSLLAAKEGYEQAGAMGAAIGASVPFVGSALRKLDNALAARRLAEVDNMVRMRSPLAQQMGADGGLPSTVVFPTAQNKLVRALQVQQMGLPPDNQDQ